MIVLYSGKLQERLKSGSTMFSSLTPVLNQHTVILLLNSLVFFQSAKRYNTTSPTLYWTTRRGTA